MRSVDLFVQSAVSHRPGNNGGNNPLVHTMEHHLLHQIDLTIKHGEWVFLVGSNGSGKSTLARLLAGLGHARVTGDIARMEDASFAPLVAQNPEAALVGMTPEEDAILLLEQLAVEAGEMPKRIDAAMRIVGLTDQMKQPIAQLSGGQKQLAAIAGCIASGADALIVDEPTAMLDPQASAAVMAALRELHRTGTTVIWVTQRLEELQEGDRVVSMKDGRIKFDGRAEQFYSRDNANVGSPCEEAGLDAPYVVHTVWELQRSGIMLDPPMPLTASSLAKAVNSYAKQPACS
ncbi:ATP-binding cassette domain-containing protein [Paenibacillus cellulosilyticus]|uniref:ATP-binding cassette domain-containing protein n=1 Tax=Paenibacillus cellulosilyticus TaxID=375489 RepID=UPI0011B6C899|nr:ATP-binding cassette domain-containing protein [Paenibacillus cellulosilyticus]QKS46174.1 ATP-binding cassette domain-containing protein [Paenibacillus cellulosilyticus]